MTDGNRGDEAWFDDERSGQFTVDARRAATEDALPMLATYFASGADTLRSQETLSRQAADDLGDVLELVQVRVLLAAANRLDPLVRAVLRAPSFRFQRERDESVGLVRGRLDTLRYLQRRHEISAPRRFPVQSVVRSHVLPENVLVAWAALSLAHAVRRLPLSRLPADAPERRRAERAAQSLRRATTSPVLAECVGPATSVWRTGTHLALLEHVRARIRAGHVAHPARYVSVADWVEQFEDKSVSLEGGQVEWVFYDETFDTKLFEIWCLERLIRSMTRHLGGLANGRLLLDRRQGPIATWMVGAVHVEVFFQAGLTAIDAGAPRWQYDPRQTDQAEPTGWFGGVPDITVVVQHPGMPRTPVIVDPKLRQRKGVPGAEIYKIIGYFGNLGHGHPNRGAIVFHGPGAQRSYRIRDDGPGEIRALAVDPMDSAASDRQFDDLALFVTASVPLSIVLRAHGPGPQAAPGEVEEWVDACQKQAVQELLDQPLAAAALERATKGLRSNLLETWGRLDPDTQRILATAEHFGGEASLGMDHSGPLLGLASACERVLRLFVEGIGVPGLGSLTFGRMLRLLRDAATARPSPLAQAVGEELDKRPVAKADLVPLIDDLFELNRDYRIPAAHADVVEEEQWLAGRASMVVGDDAALPRLVRVLGTAYL